MGVKQKIVIIGARGLLGQALKEAFEDLGPILWDKPELDITQRRLVLEKLDRLNPDVVVNAAAFSDVDGCEVDLQKRKLARMVNTDGPRNLAEAAGRINFLLVHYSTDYVFDGTKRSGYQEEDKPHPINVYGSTKHQGEETVKQRASMFYLIRSSYLFGPGGQNFVDTMLEVGRQRDELKVVSDVFSSPTYSADLALATREMIDQRLPCGVYHRTNSGVVAMDEYARTIFAEYKKIDPHFKQPRVTSVSSSELGRPARRPAYSALISTKLPPLRSFLDALKEYLQLSK